MNDAMVRLMKIMECFGWIAAKYQTFAYGANT
jgi:hypothetical protein